MHSAERPIRADETSPAVKKAAEQPIVATERIMLRLLAEMRREMAAKVDAAEAKVKGGQRSRERLSR